MMGFTDHVGEGLEARWCSEHVDMEGNQSVGVEFNDPLCYKRPPVAALTDVSFVPKTSHQLVKHGGRMPRITACMSQGSRS